MRFFQLIKLILKPYNPLSANRTAFTWLNHVIINGIGVNLRPRCESSFHLILYKMFVHLTHNFMEHNEILCLKNDLFITSHIGYEIKFLTL